MISFPQEWEAGLAAIREMPNGGVALIVGASDRGKTTFVHQVTRTLAAEGVKTAVVDTDIGQSEIGPPGTVGVAGAKREWALDPLTKLSDLKPGATFFVGAFMPGPVVAELVIAAAQAVRYARNARAQRVVVDTTGFVAGASARRLKVMKAQAIAPNLIVGIGRDGELTALLKAMRAATGAEVVSLSVPAEIGRKSTAFRATRRMTRLSHAFDGARDLALSLRDLSLIGCSLGSGELLTPELIRWASETLRIPVVRGEKGDNQLTLFVDGRPRTIPEAAISPVATYFKVSSVRLLSLSHYVDALVGFHDGAGRMLGSGRLLSLDAERDEIIVSAPRGISAEQIRLVFVGRVRVPADANGHTDIRPGEI